MFATYCKYEIRAYENQGNQESVNAIFKKSDVDRFIAFVV